AAYEARRRWSDSLDAALALDRLLDAKDRFSSAWQFAQSDDPPNLHRLQIKEAGTFLADAGAIPRPPRPASRVGRYATAAVVALGVSIPAGYLVPELVAWLASGEEG